MFSKITNWFKNSWFKNIASDEDYEDYYGEDIEFEGLEGF